MASCAFQILEGQNKFDGYFKDYEAENNVGSPGLGPRLFCRYGSSDLILNRQRAQAMLTAIARQRLCQRLLDGPREVPLTHERSSLT